MAKKRAARKKSIVVPLAKPRRRAAGKKLAGTVHTVKEPLVDVTQDVRQAIVAAPAPKAEPPKQEAPLSADERDKLHEQFTKELTHEPKKRGFFARFLGR